MVRALRSGWYDSALSIGAGKPSLRFQGKTRERKRERSLIIQHTKSKISSRPFASTYAKASADKALTQDAKTLRRS